MGAAKKAGRPRKGTVNIQLFDAMKVALKAWILADFAEINKPTLMSKARQLTGAAVEMGLMSEEK